MVDSIRSDKEHQATEVKNYQMLFYFMLSPVYTRTL